MTDDIHQPRLGLCCQFLRTPIQFKRTTAKSLLRLNREEQLVRLAQLCRHNVEALRASLDYCCTHGIGAFRISSQILPLKTHPSIAYNLEDVPTGNSIIDRFKDCGQFALENNIRLSFHPDQFVVLNSPASNTVNHAKAELIYQSEVADWLHADVINIHGGGAYGNKQQALKVLKQAIVSLPERVRKRLTLENDDKVFTPEDLFPVCEDTGTPLVYDVHHHRCLADNWSIETATEKARQTWKREPLFHLSSPLEGWGGPKPHRHHDYIDPADFPEAWHGWDLTVDVEAKAKELAVKKLREDLGT